MKAALIAAGLGERLRRDGYVQPKPLVPVRGIPLIDYALAGIRAAGLIEVVCIVNELFMGIEEHCLGRWPELEFSFVRKTTPNSMESLFTLAPLLGAERFLLLTVDAIMAPPVLQRFCTDAAARDHAAGVLATTDLVEDEKPLWVRSVADGRITALGAPAAGSGWITAGVYVFDPVIFREIGVSRQRGFGALRQFLGHLVECGFRLDALPIGPSFDVDRGEDIAAAERFIENGFRR